jgi:hypothetical protein
MKEGHFSAFAFTLGLMPPAAADSDDRSFDDFASGHSFDVFELPKHVADSRLQLEYVMFTLVP